MIQPAGIGHRGLARLAMGRALLLAAALLLISPDFSAAAASGRAKAGVESGFVHGMALTFVMCSQMHRAAENCGFRRWAPSIN